MRFEHDGNPFRSLPRAEQRKAVQQYRAWQASRARGVWERCANVEDTRADAFLSWSGVRPSATGALRYHPAMYHRPFDARLPSLIVRITPLDEPDEICAVHFVWLDPHGSGPLHTYNWNLLGFPGPSGVAQFGDVGAEDIVVSARAMDALAAGTLLKAAQIATVHTNLGALRSAPPPKGAKRATIALNATAKVKSAEDLAGYWEAAGIAVRIERPPGESATWADAARACT